MKIFVLTIFPQIVNCYCQYGIVNQAIKKGVLEVHAMDLRRFAHKRKVDDYAFGGVPGMVIKPEPVFEAYEHVVKNYGKPYTLCPEPWGMRISHEDFIRWRDKEHLLIVCGRYEGVDERVKAIVDEEVSLGDFILSGGELVALTVIDGIARLLPNVLSEPESLLSDSFNRWLGYPVYTRPREYRGMKVPQALLSGDHGKIKLWKLWHAIRRTLKNRPDMIPHELTPLEKQIIQAIEEGIEFEEWVKKIKLKSSGRRSKGPQDG